MEKRDELPIEDGQAIREWVMKGSGNASSMPVVITEFGTVWCPKCREKQSTDATVHGRWKPWKTGILAISQGKAYRLASPAHFEVLCRGCKEVYWVSARWTEGKDDVSGVQARLDLVRSVAGEHTPSAVRFFLDEGGKCRSAKANAAAAAMYRAALENLLFEQGYADGMLAKKIEALRNDHGAGKGHRWVRDVSVSELDTLKVIGNAAIHPNGGVSAVREEAIEEETLDAVEGVLEHLQKVAYEAPLKAAERERFLKEKGEAIQAKRRGA